MGRECLTKGQDTPGGKDTSAERDSPAERDTPGLTGYSGIEVRWRTVESEGDKLLMVAAVRADVEMVNGSSDGGSRSSVRSARGTFRSSVHVHCDCVYISQGKLERENRFICLVQTRK